MQITLKYLGYHNGLAFPPLYLLMFAHELKNKGFSVKLQKYIYGDDLPDYEGVPSENFYDKIYDPLRKFVGGIGGCISPALMKVDYDLLDSAKYTNIGAVVTAVGCQNKCKLCSQQNMNYVIRPTDQVAEELAYTLKTTYKYFEFIDNDISSNPNFLKLFDVVKCNGKLWGALLSPFPYSTQYLKELWGRGCRKIYTGIESFNYNDLDYYGKNYYKQVEPQVYLEQLKSIGFDIMAFVIKGLPNETPEGFKSMIAWMDSHGVNYAITPLIIKGTMSAPFKVQEACTWHNVTSFKKLLKGLNILD